MITIASNPASNMAVARIQRCAKVFITRRRLRLLSSMRAMLYAMILGHRVRRFLAQPVVKTQTKEITLGVRRENRQPANYLKEQSRKKIKAIIMQLITACDAYPNSPPAIEPLPSNRSHLVSVTDTSSVTTSNTNTLFKKQ